jgi:hypothetical protein
MEFLACQIFCIYKQIQELRLKLQVDEIELFDKNQRPALPKTTS